MSALRDDEDDAPPPRRTGPGSRRNRVRTVQLARNRLKGVRGLMIFYALLYGPLSIFVALSEPTLLGGIVLATAAVAVGGSLFLFRAPVEWTVAMAVVHTAVTVWGRIDRPTRLPIDEVIAILLWLAVPVVRRASLALADDEHASDRLSGRFETDAAESDARARSASRRFGEAQESHRTWLIAILVTIAIFIGWAALFGDFSRFKPTPPIEESLVLWEAAIEAGDLDGAAALCSEYGRTRWPNVVKILEREEWAGGVQLGDPDVRPRGDDATEVHFTLPRGTMKTMWIVEDGAWRARRVVMSKVRAK